jgi:hypothetical protein
LASFSVSLPAMAQRALIMWFSSIYKSQQAFFYFMHIVFEIFTLFMNACMFFFAITSATLKALAWFLKMFGD